jgi:hypothetical protein
VPTTFHDADALTSALLAEVMRAYHPRLVEVELRVGILMAESDDPETPAIKSGGYAVLYTCKPESVYERAKWGRDAVLKIDRRGWDDLEDDQREAAIDQALSRLDRVDLKGDELRAAIEDNAPRWKTDDRGRPKLRTVPGDFNVGDAFNAVIARHGLAAIEYRNIEHGIRSADLARRLGEQQRAAEARAAGEDAA